LLMDRGDATASATDEAATSTVVLIVTLLKHRRPLLYHLYENALLIFVQARDDKSYPSLKQICTK